MTAEQRNEISDGTLKLHVSQQGSDCVICLRGELDLANAGTLETELDSAMRAPGGKVVIDMRELEFIDSTGIALLVRAMGQNGDSGRLGFLASEFPAVSRVLALTGVAERMAPADG